jgi:hypothetical protein
VQTKRRQIQRDWVGHSVQAIGIIAGLTVALGMPLLYWGNSINIAMAGVGIRLDRSERDITEQRQSQILLTTQLVDVNKLLTKLDTQLGDIRERLPPPKR